MKCASVIDEQAAALEAKDQRIADLEHRIESFENARGVEAVAQVVHIANN